MNRDFERRLEALERLQSPLPRRTISAAPIYTVIREGEPRPNVDGPVYVLVAA
jgi:hypothetical protein